MRRARGLFRGFADDAHSGTVQRQQDVLRDDGETRGARTPGTNHRTHPRLATRGHAVVSEEDIAEPSANRK